MSFNQRMKRVLEVSTAVLLLLVLATALALKSPPDGGAAATVETMVTLNVKTLIYHCPACDLVRHCGTDCKDVDLAEARRRGAKPCRVCGGNCVAR